MRTFILVLYGTGLRLGEVSRLTHADADLRNATLLIRETKFGKSRLVRWETPRLCRGGSRSLTDTGVHRGNS